MVTLCGLLCRFIRLVGPRAKMTAAEKLSLMVAALCHDMDHPGVPFSRPRRRNHSLCLCCQMHILSYVTQGCPVYHRAQQVVHRLSNADCLGQLHRVS